MNCPFLREVVMAYCSAYSVRKMVPKDRITERCRCTCDDHATCPVFAEIMTRLRGLAGGAPEPGSDPDGPKEDPT
jgi:hypothetical protein